MRPVRAEAALVAVAMGALGCNSLAGIGEPTRMDSGGEASDAFDAPIEASSPHDAAVETRDVSVDAPEAIPSEAAPPDAPQVDAMGDAAQVDVAPADASSIGIRFRSATFGEAMMAASIAVKTPPFTAEHDLLLLTLYTDLRSTRVTAPAGWMPNGDRENAVTDFHSWWFYKFAAANEPSEATFVLNQPTLIFAGTVAYSGVDLNSPFTTGAVDDTHGTPCVAPSVHAAESGWLIVAAFSHDTARKWARVSPIDQRIAYQGLFVGDFPQLVAGETPTKSIDCTPTGDGSVTVFGLRPARP
jgi:hypothetical protein